MERLLFTSSIGSTKFWYIRQRILQSSTQRLRLQVRQLRQQVHQVLRQV
jgi:hypothetical protein